MSDGNGKASMTVILWVMGVIFLGGLTMTANAVIANDRIREAKDDTLRCEIDRVKGDFNDKLGLILTKLARLETLMSPNGSYKTGIHQQTD